MKSLSTLIRLKQEVLDEKRLVLTRLETEAADIKSMIETLAVEVACETEAARGDAESSFGFGSYIAAAKARRGGLEARLVQVDEKIAEAADEVSEAVTALGAANCLVPIGDGRVRAENTDGLGFLAGLVDDAGNGVVGRRVAILGAGGAARAVAHACGDAGATGVLVVNRTPERAATTAALAGPAGLVANVADIATADVVVNATPEPID